MDTKAESGSDSDDDDYVPSQANVTKVIKLITNSSMRSRDFMDLLDKRVEEIADGGNPTCKVVDDVITAETIILNDTDYDPDGVQKFLVQLELLMVLDDDEE
jgi:hypothetical protein